MRTTFKKIALLAVSISFFMVSCSSDDDNESVSQGVFENGIFITNEGNSALSTASISFIAEDGTVEQDIFRAINPNAEELGTYLQDMFFDDTRAFIISGSANKITVVDRYTFQYIATISTNINNPRYGVVENGKAFIVNQADWSTGADDYVTVVNLLNYTTSTIALEVSSDRITKANGKVYVSNGYYGSGNSVSVINPATNVVEDVIDLGAGNSPSTLQEKNGVLYVLAGAEIFKINTVDNLISGSTAIPTTIERPKNLTIADSKIYFTGNSTSVYATELNATTVSSTAILSYTSTSAYGPMYGFAVNNGKIYISDGGDFASDSKAYVYSTSGSLLNTHTVGVGPNGFYFN
ncbi:DUF5074 domain-containing protein [Flavobacterium ardleyense]|uniref:DUF5074 domain-containing protein n=1 Tax=Flavobacterium ardleyense TaxID=2038737 RepID=A0ABW5Z9Z2_9FLAO